MLTSVHVLILLNDIAVLNGTLIYSSILNYNLVTGNLQVNEFDLFYSGSPTPGSYIQALYLNNQNANDELHYCVQSGSSGNNYIGYSQVQPTGVLINKRIQTLEKMDCLAIRGDANSVTLALRLPDFQYYILDIQYLVTTNGVTWTMSKALSSLSASNKMISSTKSFYLFGTVSQVSTSFVLYSTGKQSGLVLNSADNCAYSSYSKQLDQTYGTWYLPQIEPLEFTMPPQNSTSSLLSLGLITATDLLVAVGQPSASWCSLQCSIDNQTALNSVYYYTIGSPPITLNAPVLISSNCSSTVANPFYFRKNPLNTAIQLQNTQQSDLQVVISTSNSSQAGRYAETIVYAVSWDIQKQYEFMLFINDNRCDNPPIIAPPDAVYNYSIGDSALTLNFDEFQVTGNIICYFFLDNTYLNDTFYHDYVKDSSTIFNYLQIQNTNTSAQGGDFIIIQNASWGNSWATRQITIRVNISCSQDVVTIQPLGATPYYWDLSQGSTESVLLFNITHSLPTCYVQIKILPVDQNTTLDPIFSFNTSEFSGETAIMSLSWATTDPQKAFLSYFITITSIVYYQNYAKNNTFSQQAQVRISNCIEFNFTLTPQVYYYTLSLNSSSNPFNVTVSNTTQASPFCNISYSAVFDANMSIIPSNDSDVTLNSTSVSLDVHSTDLSKHASYSLPYTLTGVVQYTGFNQTVEETLYMIDPCVTSTLFASIYNNTYLTETLNNYSVFKGSESNISLGSLYISYNSSLPNHCGGVRGQVYMFDDPSIAIDSSVFTFSSSKMHIMVNTSDVSKIGIYHFVYHFSLFSYPLITGEEHVYINIFCNITSFEVVSTSSFYQYLVGSAPLTIFGASFSQSPSCNYPITFSATYSNGKPLSDLSNLIDYDPSNNTFIVETSNPQQSSYNLTVVGVLTDEYNEQFIAQYSFVLSIYSNDIPSTINTNTTHTSVNSTSNATKTNYTSSSSSTDSTSSNDSTVSDIDYSALNQSKSTFVRQNTTFYVPQNIDLVRQSKTLTALIQEVTLTGGVKIKFSEKIGVPDYCLYYDNSILNVSINSPNSTIQHWNVSSCGEYEIYLQLNFTNTLQISSTLVKDQVQVVFIGNGYFRTIKDNTSIPYYYTLTSAIPPQLENSSTLNNLSFQLQRNCS